MLRASSSLKMPFLMRVLSSGSDDCAGAVTAKAKAASTIAPPTAHWYDRPVDAQIARLFMIIFRVFVTRPGRLETQCYQTAAQRLRLGDNCEWTNLAQVINAKKKGERRKVKTSNAERRTSNE